MAFASWDMSLGETLEKCPGKTIVYSSGGRCSTCRTSGVSTPRVWAHHRLLTSLTQSQSTFGAYTNLLTQPRVMQFALRYEF